MLPGRAVDAGTGGAGCTRRARAGRRRGRRRLHDARLGDGRPLGRRHRPRGLRHPAGFFDAQAQRRRHEPAGGCGCAGATRSRARVAAISGRASTSGSSTATGGASTCVGRRRSRRRPRGVSTGGGSSTTGSGSYIHGSTTGSGSSGCTGAAAGSSSASSSVGVHHRPDRLHEPRRTQHGRGRLGRLGRLLERRPLLRARSGRRSVLGEHVAAGQRDVALPGHTLDERARHDLFDRARRALELDAVLLLQESQHFLARGIEQLSDFVDANRGQSDSFVLSVTS